MVNIQDLFDDAKCYQTIREMRWPGGVTCPRCSSESVIRNGRDDTEPHPPHRHACTELLGLLTDRLSRHDWMISPEKPLALPGDYRPHPDLAVYRGPSSSYFGP